MWKLRVYTMPLLTDDPQKRAEAAAMLAEDALRMYLTQTGEDVELHTLTKPELSEIVQMACAASTARSLAKLAFQPDRTLVELDPPISH